MLKSLSKQLPPLLHSSRRLSSGSMQINYSYIRKKQLDEIESAHGSTTSQKMLMYSKQAKHIYSEGWAALKKDIATFRSLKKKEKEGNIDYSHDEQQLQKRLWRQIEGLKTLAIIQILPFSGPLLIYYLYVYPTSLPSWFSVDAWHENYQRQCIQTQEQAVQYFQKHPLNTKGMKLMDLKLQELKKLSQLLFGHFEDGVIGYNKIMAPKTKSYLFHSSFSKLLLVRTIKKEFKADLQEHPLMVGRPVEELVAWKYERVMSGLSRLKFQPVHQDILSNNVSIDALDALDKKK